MTKIQYIKKRSGKIEAFDKEKITNAIWEAEQSIGEKNKDFSVKIADQITSILNVFFKDPESLPESKQIQDLIEKILIENGHIKTAKSYISSIEKQNKNIKNEKSEEKDTKFSLNALNIMQRNYLKKDEKGVITESPKQLFERVAHNIAKIDLKYGDFDAKKTEKSFYKMMYNLEFLPDPTILKNIETTEQLTSSFVLPIENNIEDIFNSLKNATIINQEGGKIGLNFSKIQPRGEISHSSKKHSKGPLSFLKVFNIATETIKQESREDIINTGILNIDHPDILEFISSKDTKNALQNFKIAVLINNKFLKAVKEEKMYDLIDPVTNKPINSLHAKSVFELLITKTWTNGEPKIIFKDKIEKENKTPKIGELTVSLNGAQPLLENETITLGDINLSKFVNKKNIEWEKLKTVIKLAIHFLDNALDASNYKLENIQKTTMQNRKIGLGIMGFSEMLFQLEIAYNSEEGINIAEKIMKFIKEEGLKTSQELAQTRGSFPNFEISQFPKEGYEKMRNATITTISQTKITSKIAGTTAGIEPISKLINSKKSLNGENKLHINKYFKQKTIELNIFNKDLINLIEKEKSIKKINSIPESLKKIFVITEDINYKWHIKMQSIFQKYTDNGVSKTIYFPSYSSAENVKEAILLAHKLGCKGVSIFRDKNKKKHSQGFFRNIDYTNNTPEDQYEDKQVSLPFNSESFYKHRIRHKNTQEVIPPPIIN